jgi:CheY-like chemotaxis protein
MLFFRIADISEMSPDDALTICNTCGKSLRKGDPRYRTPVGESHVRCHEGPRVLVVEDDSVLLELIVDVMQRVGYLTNHATNGQEALRHLDTHGYDLILCDLQMPTMDGPAFYREVQRHFPDAVSRAVFMTAHLNLDEFLPFLNEVGAPVLQKPFSVEELRATVARLVGPPSSRQRPLRPR